MNHHVMQMIHDVIDSLLHKASPVWHASKLRSRSRSLTSACSEGVRSEYSHEPSPVSQFK